MTDAFREESLGEALGKVRSNWGWFVVFGALLVLLGLIALGNLAVATVASIFVVGVVMIVGGIAHIILAFRGRSWHSFLGWLLGGMLYLIAGVLVFADPALASSVLTLVIAFALLAAGAARIWFGFAVRPEKGWLWIAAAGVVTILAGLVIATGWPVNSLWVIGLFLGVDLLFQGGSFIVFGLALRART